MNIIILFILLMLCALIIVSLLNEKQRKEQMRRQQQRRLRVQVEELYEVLTCIEQTVGDKNLAKKINDIIIGLLETMRRLEVKPSPYIDASLQKVTAHRQDLDNPQFQPLVRYERESDAQINKTQKQLMDTIELLSSLAAQGRISEQEFEYYQHELRWSHLMVAVMSYIAQGNKSLMGSDRITALAFYQRALHHLMESAHSDPKRLTLIREINELIDGSRTRLSESLVGANQNHLAEMDI
jgi:hypothetical protein